MANVATELLVEDWIEVRKMEISHPWHEHPLFLFDEPKFVDHCSICEKRLQGEPFYACVGCRYHVHKSCAQLPEAIQHRFHPRHPLALSLCSGDSFACNSCHKSFEDELRFRCSTCNFDLDVKCATMSDIDTERKEFIRHVTHQHPLTVCNKDGENPLTCFACKKTSSDLIYGCPPCEYFIHKSCSELSSHVLHAMHPQHVLRLRVGYGLCYYCQLFAHTWKYRCRLCRFSLDVSCLIESAKDAQNLERSCFICSKKHSDSASCIDLLYFINQSCIQLPKEIEHEFHSHKLLLLHGAKDFGCDSCHKWFHKRSHYGCVKCNFRMDFKCTLMGSIGYEDGDQSVWPDVPPHFNHQHPLRLIGEEYGINCSACHTTKLSPIYDCFKCDYFLHQFCLELPIQVEYPLHDSHVLSIQPLCDNFCHVCCRKYDGFAFGCTQCRFFIGIECIFELPPSVSIVHKYHHHLLFLTETSYCDWCNADNAFCQFFGESTEFKHTKSHSLRCIECGYNLHLICGPLPCTIKHKSHLHVLTLVDGIVEDYSDEYYCDICEELRNPRFCVYYCEDCQFFSHVHCVISEIINVFKKNSNKVEMRIVGDLRLEDTTLDNILSQEVLLDLLKRLEADEVNQLKDCFPHAELFPREKEDHWVSLGQKSSSKDVIMNIEEELFFYNDDIRTNIWKRVGLFKPCTKYHIQPDELSLPIIEVKPYKVPSNFSSLLRTLLRKYFDFGSRSGLSNNADSVVLYFLCRVLRSMSRTFIVDITEIQLFTWLYYISCIREYGFDLGFIDPFLQRIMTSYFGLQAIKFESEAPERLDQEIVNLEQKISDLKSQIEELKWHRQQHKPGKIVMEQKWQLAGKGIF